MKVSGFKTMTGERGLKNPIQRTTFYLQRRSGARVMTCFVFAKTILLLTKTTLLFAKTVIIREDYIIVREGYIGVREDNIALDEEM